MSSANISWLFYKDYFADINYQNLDDKNNVEKIKQKVQNIIDQAPKIKDLNDKISWEILILKQLLLTQGLFWEVEMPMNYQV